MKKIVIISISLLLLMILLAGCGKKEEEKNNNDIKTNISEGVIKDQHLEVFTFTNTSLVYENGTSYLETIVTNTSDVDQYLEEFKIHVKDVEGNEIMELSGFIGNYIKANSSSKITSSCGEDLTSAKSIEYSIIR